MTAPSTNEPAKEHSDVTGESLTDLLGGRGGALDATLPPLAFLAGWLAAGQSIAVGAAAAVVAGVAVGAFRLARGGRVTATVVSVGLVGAAALITLYTGHAEDFFLLRLLSNGASALAWAASILVRWPLLGVVVGLVLGQRARWRRDPDLVRAYSRASWVWVFLQYTLRVVVWGALWWAGQVVALGVVTIVLSWPLLALTFAVGGWVLFRSLPPEHPGLRHPRPRGAGAEDVDGG